MQDSSIVWQVQHPVLSGISLKEKCKEGKQIKISPMREVWEIEIGGEEYIVKIFHSPSILDRLRSWLHPREWQEWKNLKKLHELQIPVPMPVALGKDKKASYLLTKKIPGSRTLKEICKVPLTLSQRRSLALKLARVTASLHNKGWIHKDFHSGNLLLDREENLYLIDTYNLSHFSSINKRQAFQNLAMLGISFSFSASYTDFFSFFKEYFLQSTLFSSKDFFDSLKKANECFIDWFCTFCTKKSLRCLKENKYFQKIDGESGTGFLNREEQDVYFAIQNLPSLPPQGTVFKDSRSTLVLRASFGIWKQYRRKKARNLLLDCFRKSRARRAWLAGYNCLFRGIPTAKPLVFQEKRFFFFLTGCYIVTKEIQNALILPHYLTFLGNSEEGESRKHILLRQLGRMIRIMHNRGLTHRDMKGNNLLVDQQEKIYLIDLDGLSVRKRVTQIRRQKDLKRLIAGLKQVEGIKPEDIEILLDGYYPFGGKGCHASV